MNKENIKSMTLRQMRDGWELSAIDPTSGTENRTQETEKIKDEINELLEFAAGLKSEAELEAERERRERETLLKIITEETTDVQKLHYSTIYPEYQDGETYSGDMDVPYLRYKGTLYKVISDKPFKAQETWTPDVAVSLFKEVVPPGTIGKWRQPLGAHDAYHIGDRVIFGGYVYCSIIDNNVWSPTSHPEGWEKERKAEEDE